MIATATTPTNKAATNAAERTTHFIGKPPGESFRNLDANARQLFQNRKPRRSLSEAFFSSIFYFLSSHLIVADLGSLGCLIKELLGLTGGLFTGGPIRPGAGCL
jgi:hypothetical protein